MKQLGWITKVDESHIQSHVIFLMGEEDHDETQKQLTDTENQPDFICWLNHHPESGYIFYDLKKKIKVPPEELTKEEFDAAIAVE